MKITKATYKKEFNEIKKYFNLSHFGTIDNRNEIATQWGLYSFFFDDDTIFGRFIDLKKEVLPAQFQSCNGADYFVKHYPSHNGKMNFHYESVFDFIDTIDRIMIETEAA